MNTLEINKKIAEIKRYKISDKYRCSSVNNLGCKNAVYRESGIPYNWAENISDAWELFEEMKSQINNLAIVFNKSSYPNVYTDLYKCGSVSVQDFCGGDKDPYVSVDGEESITAPLAICLAWLKWKESLK